MSSFFDRLREEKMKEKQKHQEERLRAALERAVAQPKKKVCVLLPIGPALSICECFCGIKTKYLIHVIYPALIGLSLIPCYLEDNSNFWVYGSPLDSLFFSLTFFPSPLFFSSWFMKPDNFFF